MSAVRALSESEAPAADSTRAPHARRPVALSVELRVISQEGRIMACGISRQALIGFEGHTGIVSADTGSVPAIAVWRGTFVP